MPGRIQEKRWSVEWERELVEAWEREGLFRTEVDPSRERYLVIDTPPPYPTAERPHIGQTASYAHMDAVARFYRMRGYNVVFPFYLDRNGLPIEVRVERTYNVNAREVPREKFIEMCRAELDKLERGYIETFRRWGMSFDYWPQGTDSEEYRAMTQRTFIEMWGRGLIYESERPAAWCPRCGTALAEAETEYEEEEGTLNYIRFRVRETGEDIVIATTRPELLPATVAVIYNPADDRYRHLEGKHALVPPMWQEVPILPHPAAKPEYGTGLVMISTFGDVRDLAIVNELRLPIRVIVDERGNITAGRYAGLNVREARRRTIEDLRREGLLVRQETVRHNVPVCWRCKTPIELIVTRELFVRQLDHKERLLELVGEMRFYPPEHAQRLRDWISSLQFDWPVSRRRYYATEVPLWYCEEPDGAVRPIAPRPGRYYRPWLEEPPPEVREQCRGRLRGDDRVLDTWFDSSISWMYASGATKPHVAVFERVYPHSILRPQGYDIIRTWLYYSVVRAYHLFGRPPFAHVRINGMGLDERGEAMHKSKGNVIDPLDPVERYGADAVRFWAAAAGRLGSDYRYSEALIRTGKELATKVWNLARFVSSFPEAEDGYELAPLDRAVLARLHSVATRVIAAYTEFDVYEPANALMDFIWHDFADHYVEGVKSRAYNRDGAFDGALQRGAWHTLHYVLRYSLKLLAPIMPFMTDKLWRLLYGRTIHREPIEDPPPEHASPDHERLFLTFKRINSAVWRYKNMNGRSLAEPLDGYLHVPEHAGPLAVDLLHMHRARGVRTGAPRDNYVTLDAETGVYLSYD